MYLRRPSNGVYASILSIVRIRVKVRVIVIVMVIVRVRVRIRVMSRYYLPYPFLWVLFLILPLFVFGRHISKPESCFINTLALTSTLALTLTRFALIMTSITEKRAGGAAGKTIATSIVTTTGGVDDDGR